MIDVNTLKILFLNRREDLVIKLNEIGDEIEHGELNRIEVIKFSEYVLDLAIEEGNIAVKESLFRILLNAAVYQNIGKNVEWDKLANVLPILHDTILDLALTILGFSKNRKFIPVIETYSNSPIDYIKQTAVEALMEIKHS